MMSLAESRKVQLRIRELATGLAFDQTVGAMQLHQAFSRSAGPRMEAINVLRDYRGDFASLFQANNCFVNGVWLRIAESRPGLQLVIPMLDARCFRTHEVVIIHRLPARPDAVRPAKIGNTAASGNTGPRKKQDLLPQTQARDKFIITFQHEIKVARRGKVSQEIH